jgi:hypothetical protein
VLASETNHKAAVLADDAEDALLIDPDGTPVRSGEWEIQSDNLRTSPITVAVRRWFQRTKAEWEIAKLWLGQVGFDRSDRERRCKKGIPNGVTIRKKGGIHCVRERQLIYNRPSARASRPSAGW